MYAIAAIGLLTMILSVIMIVGPGAWSRRILRFSEKSYFHVTEIAIRLVLGAVLFYFAEAAMFPTFVKILGGGLMLVGFFLVLIGPGRHIEFAKQSATFTRIFRPAGFVSFAFGGFLVYISRG